MAMDWCENHDLLQAKDQHVSLATRKVRWNCRCLAWFLYEATYDEAVKEHAKHVKKVGGK